MVVVVLGFIGSLLFVHVATPGSGIEVFDRMIRECEETGKHCPTEYRFQFRAFQQLYILDVEVAKKFVPEDVHLMSLFGKTVGALFVVEYDFMSYDPDGNVGPNGEPPARAPVREIDVLQMLATGPAGVLGAWATHVLISSPVVKDVGRHLVGLPTQLTDVQVEHYCDPASQGINFVFGDKGSGKEDTIVTVKVCLPLGPGEGWRDLAVLTNHTLPNLTGKLPLDRKGKISNAAFTAGTHVGEKVGPFMSYLLTFFHADLRLGSPVPVNVVADVENAVVRDFKDLVGGTIIPFATVFDNVDSTTWRPALMQEDGSWKLTEQCQIGDSPNSDTGQGPDYCFESDFVGRPLLDGQSYTIGYKK
jgi:hypothetical protein